MNLTKLYEIQKKLDDRIHQEHGLENENLVPAKILALEVELGELANETRCFKFWSKKPPAPKAAILEEYVDCLHFILSLGLDTGLTDVCINRTGCDDSLIHLFQDMFIETVKFKENPTLGTYESLFNKFLLLGERLGFSESEIYAAYLDKNKINHQRQAEGY